jgi:hypothetical protein
MARVIIHDSDFGSVEEAKMLSLNDRFPLFESKCLSSRE